MSFGARTAEEVTPINKQQPEYLRIRVRAVSSIMGKSGQNGLAVGC